MWGASLGHPAVCELLLEASASPDNRDGDGWDALMLAVDRSHIEPVEMLVRAGASPSTETRYGKSALSIARGQGGRGSALLALLESPPPPPLADDAEPPPQTPAAPGKQTARPGTAPAGRQTRPGTAGGSSRRAGSASPTRMSQRKRPSTAARELQEAIEQMNEVNIHMIGSAGFSTIIQARQYGVPTVIEAMLAYAEHHGVQHFGVAALAEQHELQPGSLVPSAQLCSALIQASAAHPARQADVVLPAMSLLVQSFLQPLAFAEPPPPDQPGREQLGAAVAGSMCVLSTAVALGVMLMHDIRAGEAEPDLSEPPHLFIEDTLELLLLGLRSGHASSTQCLPVLAEGGVVQALVTVAHVYGRRGRDHPQFVRYAASALCLLSAPQPRYGCEPGGQPAMPTLRRRRRLTILRADELCFRVDGPRGSGNEMNPYAVVWWEGQRLGRTHTLGGTETAAWGTALQLSLPLGPAELRIEVFSARSSLPEPHSQKRGKRPQSAPAQSNASNNDRLVGGVTLRLGDEGDPGGASVILPPYMASLEIVAPESVAKPSRPRSAAMILSRPRSAKPKVHGEVSASGGLISGKLLLSIEEQVGGLALEELVRPSCAQFASALSDSDGLRTLIDACASPTPRLLPSGDDFEDEDEEQTKAEMEEEALLHAFLVLDVLRTGASFALSGCNPAAREMPEYVAVSPADVEEVLLESGLLALARSVLLPPPDEEQEARRAAGEGLSAEMLATQALRAMTCMAAMLSNSPKGFLSLSLEAEGVPTVGSGGEAVAGLVLDAALAHADLATKQCHPVLDAAWALLRRLDVDRAECLGWAARATFSRVATPHSLRIGPLSLAAGALQARAVHCVHWLWHGGGGSAEEEGGWAWASAVEVQRLVPAVLSLLDAGGASVGEQQDEACRLVSLLLCEGPTELRHLVLEEVSAAGGLRRLAELLDDGTPAMSWSKANAAVALQAAQNLCAPEPAAAEHQQRAELAELAEDQEEGEGEQLAERAPWGEGMALGAHSGLLLELLPSGVACALDRAVLRHTPTAAALLILVVADARLDSKLLERMAEMAYERRRANGGGEEAVVCALGVLGCDGRGVGAPTSTAPLRSLKLLELKPERLPALVRIEQGQVAESREFGVEEGGACGRGGEQAQSSALPPLTPAALQQAVQAMLP